MQYCKDIGLKRNDYKQDGPAWKVNNDQLLKLEAEGKDLEKQVAELQAEQSDPEQELLSIEQFLNLARATQI